MDLIEKVLEPDFWTLQSVSIAAVSLLVAVCAAIFQDAIKRLVEAGLRAIATSFAVGLSNLLLSDVRRVFRNRREAESYIARDMSQSNFVFAFIGRGNYLQREITNRIDQTDKTRNLRILTPMPSSEISQGPDWTAINEQELARFDKLYGAGKLSEQLERTIDDLAAYEVKGVLQARRINTPHFGRLIITERNCYFTPYNDTQPSADNRTIAFANRKNAVMYPSYLRLFNLWWEQGQS